jgi:hypothetical protein
MIEFIRAVKSHAAILLSQYEDGAKYLPNTDRHGMCREFNVALQPRFGRTIDGPGYVVGRAMLGADTYAAGLGPSGVFTTARANYLRRLLAISDEEMQERIQEVITNRYPL